MRDLWSPAKVSEILKQHNFHTTKSLGQNFLVDANIINKIISTAEISNQDLVIEIGTGIGVLTGALAEKANKVIAVEIDKRLIPILEDTLAAYNNIEVVLADAMKVNFDRLAQEKTNGCFGSKGKSYKLVANLPYYITTPLIMHLLSNKFNLDSLVIMVQKEVAMRLAAGPNNKNYGAITVAVQYYTRPEIVFKVPRTVFYPRPDVDSAVVKLQRRKKPPVAVKDEDVFFKVVRAAFGQRRKTLLNALTGSDMGIAKEKLIEVLSEVDIDYKRRGETLSLEEFALIANNLASK